MFFASHFAVDVGTALTSQNRWEVSECTYDIINV